MPVMSKADIRLNRRGIPVLSRHWASPGAWASMLILPGIGDHSGRWERTGSIFADAGIEVWSFDLVGFGGSGGDRAYIESWSRYLDDVADQLTPVFQSGRPSVLLGHSFGGLVAASYGLSLHRQTDYLVLSAPGFEYGGPAWQRPAATVLAKLVPKMRIPNAFDGANLSRDPAVGEAYDRDPLVVKKTTGQLAALGFGEMDRVVSQLPALKMPILVVHGGADPMVPPSGSVAVGQLPNATRRVYPHLRHETLNEPEGPEVAADIIGWIKARVEERGQAS